MLKFLRTSIIWYLLTLAISKSMVTINYLIEIIECYTNVNLSYILSYRRVFRSTSECYNMTWKLMYIMGRGFVWSCKGIKHYLLCLNIFIINQWKMPRLVNLCFFFHWCSLHILLSELIIQFRFSFWSGGEVSSLLNVKQELVYIT